MKTCLVLVLNSLVHDSRVLKECTTLANSGYRVHVFCMREAGVWLPEKMPFGYATGFSARPWKSPHKVFKLFKFIEVAIRMVRAAARIRPDIVHANDLETLPIGYALSRLHRAKLVYDSHELWRDPGSRVGIPSWLFRLALVTERVLAPKADGVITVSESIARDMQHHLRIPLPTLVRNVPMPKVARADEAELCRPLREGLGLSPGVPIIIYQGLWANGYGVQFLLEAFSSVARPAVLVYLGYGPLKDELARRAGELGVADRVHFHPAVSPDVLISYTADATIGVCPIQRACTSYDYSLPNKLFEYVQAGIPVAGSNLTEIGNLISHYGLGEVFAESNAGAIAETLNRMLSNPALLRQYRDQVAVAAKELHWKNEEVRLTDLYQNLCPTSVSA